MTKFYLITGIVILVIVAGAIFWSNQSGFVPAPSQSGSSGSPTQASSSATSQTSKNQTSSNLQPASTSVAGVTSSTIPVSAKYIIHADDSGADLTKIVAFQGNVVQITFVVSSTGTYHGGLDFRSSVVNTGPISPGNSKTVVFTATQSFAFTPYWPSSNIQKPYRIMVSVGIP